MRAKAQSKRSTEEMLSGSEYLVGTSDARSVSVRGKRCSQPAGVRMTQQRPECAVVMTPTSCSL
ncbi:MAG: hypothetical protein LC742_08775 [Acidobacteria bacterium]|nr:hypothetical protein [Acidobacteriota bacterium]